VQLDGLSVQPNIPYGLAVNDRTSTANPLAAAMMIKLAMKDTAAT
jgi:hypothetical protein